MTNWEAGEAIADGEGPSQVQDGWEAGEEIAKGDGPSQVQDGREAGVPHPVAIERMYAEGLECLERMYGEAMQVITGLARMSGANLTDPYPRTVEIDAPAANRLAARSESSPKGHEELPPRRLEVVTGDSLSVLPVVAGPESAHPDDSAAGEGAVVRFRIRDRRASRRVRLSTATSVSPVVESNRG